MKKRLLPHVLFHQDVRLMVYRPRGILDEKTIGKIIAMLEEIEDEAKHPFNRYTDFSKLEAVDLSFEFVFRVSLHRRLAYVEHPPVKSAFYVTSPATEQIVRTHGLITERSPLDVQLFRTEAAAGEWLGVSVEDLQIDV